MKCWIVTAGATLVALAATARGQWDPQNGDWGRTDSRDLRVMTWNVQDGICSTNDKVDGLNNWNGLVRIVAAMKPDVLLLQETGDNDGNNTGSGVDSIQTLEATLELFFHGGQDPYNPGDPDVTSFVEMFDADFDLPYIFVSAESDGFNRNVILSRYPFVDLNGDGEDRYSDIPFIFCDDCYAGGSGGIRGFQFAEIDLPDNVYGGDLVVGNAHLKSGGGTDDRAARLDAAMNVSYFIYNLYNGAGTSTPDPNDAIFDNPPAGNVLDPLTPVVFGGDWNEDETSNGRKGPADWLTDAQFSGGPGGDGTDQDGSDSVYDDAVDPFTGSDATLSGSKLDYVAFQDSIAEQRRAFVFNSSSLDDGEFPPELADFFLPSLLSGIASDHRPVIVDLILPAADEPACAADLDGDGDTDLADLSVLLGNFGTASGASRDDGDLDGDGDVDIGDLSTLLGDYGCAP